jgi:hypothetical protein
VGRFDSRKFGGERVKVFQVTEYEWVTAETPEQAQAVLLEWCGGDYEESLRDFGAPREVAGESLDRLRVTIEDETVFSTARPGSYTFREALAHATAPGFFATTEW